MLMRIHLALLMLVVMASAAVGQTFTVTSPTDGTFIGLNNQVKFTITGAVFEVRIDVTANGPGGVQFTNTGRFTPDAEGRINSQLALNFNQGVPEGLYTITVTATEPGHTYSPATIGVTLDVTKPKFLQFNPIANTFVRGEVFIRVKVLEPNFKDYRVQVDGQDIPNNTGTSLDPNGEFLVRWDTAGIQFDGSKSISIRLRDEAENEENRTVSVNLDRIQPVVNIVQPRADVRLAARSNVSIIIDVTDPNGAGSSVHVSGIDVIARTMEGQFIGRGSMASFRSTGTNNLRWAGRIRYRSGLPKKFKIIVTAIDRAGNPAVSQEVIVSYR